MKRILPIILLIILGLFGLLYLRNWQVQSAQAATANYIVISEIQVAGAETTHDFIELYNPTVSDINLGDFRLVRRTGIGDADDSIVAFTSGDIIPAHGYFLWCNTAISDSLSCDSSTGATIANNNSVGLREGDLDTGALVDAVSFGSVTNTLGEGSSLTAPTASTSVERKANSASTDITMGIGGTDEFMGNAWDTDNNTSDFVGRALSQSQNSASEIEPVEAPSPTDEPSPTPTAEPSVSPEPTVEPSVTPTIEPSPTNEPSPTPTEEPSPSPTAEPSPFPTEQPSPTPTVELSPTPTIEPSPTAEPSPTEEPSPTLEPTPTPTGDKIIHQNFIITCTLNFKPMRIFNKAYFFPLISCHKTAFN